MHTDPGTPVTPRQRDRRCGIQQVLQATVAAMQGDDSRSVAESFEASVGEVLGLSQFRIAEPRFGHRGAGPVEDARDWNAPVPGTAAVVRCTGGGAIDPWREQQLQWLAAAAALVLELDRLRGRPARRRPGHDTGPVLVGTSADMRAVRHRIARVAPTTCPVLIQGESGAGKEVVARLVHDESRRARGPFVAVNCAAIVESLLEAELFGIEDRTATGVRGRRGKFELAAGGTLFLDEIGDLATSAQAKLLRVLQDLTIERVGGRTQLPVDVRIVAATNRDLRRLVDEGRFRADLYYRLNGVEIDVPPLRSHLEDLPALVDHVLRRHVARRDEVRIEPEAFAALGHYGWPGNVRELERVIERAVVLSIDGVVGIQHLPPALAGEFDAVFAHSLRAGDTLKAFGARYVRLVVDRCGNNLRAASRVLDISYHTLRTYLKRNDPPATWSRLPGDAAPMAFETSSSGAGLVADRDQGVLRRP